MSRDSALGGKRRSRTRFDETSASCLVGRPAATADYVAFKTECTLSVERQVTTTITGTITDGLFKGRLPATLVLRLSFGARMPLAGAGPSATGPAPIHCRPRT